MTLATSFVSICAAVFLIDPVSEIGVSTKPGDAITFAHLAGEL